MADTQVMLASSRKHLQRNGKWGEHIEGLINRANKRIDILRNIKGRLDRRSLEKLYMAYVRPILENGSSVWITATQKKAKSSKAFN